jgi:hypothetical protein
VLGLIRVYYASFCTGCSIHSPLPSLLPPQVPGEVGYFGEVTKVFSQAFAAAKKDVQAGSYFTINTLTCVLPLLFAGFSVLLAFLPVEEEVPRRRMAAKAPTAEDMAAVEPVADKKSD